MLFLSLAALPIAAHAWTFTIESFPTQCNPLNITWDDVTPRTFTLLGLSGIGTNFSSWDTGYALQYNGGPSEEHNTSIVQASWEFPFAAGTPLVIIGSDTTGFATGGTSDVYMVQPNSEGYAGCVETFNVTYLSKFPLWVPLLPYQCGPMVDQFWNFSAPVQTAVVIPGGESFLVEDTMYTNFSGGGVTVAAQVWNMSIPDGTNIAFWVQDANGPLFVSGLQTVRSAPWNEACPPDQTVHSSTAGPAAGALSTSPPTSLASGSTNHAGAIAGGVIGSVVGIIITVALVIFLLRYNRQKRPSRQTIGLVAYAPRPASQCSTLVGETWSRDKKDNLPLDIGCNEGWMP